MTSSDRCLTRKPHWIAVLATVFVAAILLVANLDGYHNHLFNHFFAGDTEFADDPRTALFNWSHGWPWMFMVRASIYPLSGVYTGNGFIGAHGFNSRWPFDDARVFLLDIKPLVFDCVCCIALVVGTAYATQRLGCWLYPRNSYGLKTLFIATAIAAVFICFGPDMFTDDSRYSLYYTTLSVAGIATVLTLFSVGHIAYRVFYRRRDAIRVLPSAP
jgi:hypothetical protein